MIKFMVVSSIRRVEVQLLKNLQRGSWLLWPVTTLWKLYIILARSLSEFKVHCWYNQEAFHGV